MESTTVEESQRSPGKDYYNIFPTPGSDYDSTASFIKATVGTDDLNPWTDVKENLVSWTVEADDDQVTTLRSHPGIKQITKLALPAATTPTAANTTTQEAGGSSPALTNRQEEVRDWMIRPTNPADMVQVNETTQFLRSLTGSEPIQYLQDNDKDLHFWVVGMTDSQHDQAVKNPGISEMALDVPLTRASVRSEQEAVQEWIILPTNHSDMVQVNETTQFLRSLTGSEPMQCLENNDKDLQFWVVRMTDSQHDQAIKNPGISTMGLNEPWTLDSVSDLAAAGSLPRSKRDLSYSTQKDAVRELVSISQPSTVPKIKQLKNYVSESHQGHKVVIYHIEEGVAFLNQPAEFPHVSAEHIFTPLAEMEGRRAGEEYSTGDMPFHGTCTADKALGAQYGAAKQATLTTVVMAEITTSEILFAFSQITTDLRNHPERRKFSVVTMSCGGPTVSSGSPLAKYLRSQIETIMEMDVPVVVSAGNRAQEPGRELVDTVPAAFAAPDFPLIVVGSSTASGRSSAFSQKGPQVTIHAVGEGITCVQKDSNQPPAKKLKGTSFSAPLVAGEIANLLSYDTVPFDTSDGNLVRSVRDYLVNSPAAGWSRKPTDVRMLWNGVTEANNPREAPASPMSSPPQPVVNKTCAGLAAAKYVGRETLRSIIEDHFCPDAVAQGVLDKDSGSISRRYNQGTMDEVGLGIDYAPGLDFRPNMPDCVRYLLAELTDGCDGNDPDNNPENYKGGGTMKVGPVAYQIWPQAVRQPAKSGLQGGCDGTYKFLWDEFTMWGHGFASSDFGAALKGQVDDCALLPDTWDFQYGLGSDGREWTAKFRTGVFQKHCVGQAGKEAGAPGDFGCRGSG